MLKHYDREKVIWDSLLNSNEKLTLLALNSFVDANGECWPGQELLARMTGFTDRTIRNICANLEEKLIIVRSHRQRNDGSRTSDKYQVDFDAIAKYQPENISARKQRRCFKKRQSKQSAQPENISARKIQPENDDNPTGKSRHIQPEKFSGDLSSKNYPVELSRKEGVIAVASPPLRSPKSSKKKTAKQIYAELVEAERFEKWWAWYKAKCKQYKGNFGDKASAAEQWTFMVSDVDFDFDRFRSGCQAWARKLEISHVGEIVHGYIFLKGKETHPTPYWESALEAEDYGLKNDFIPDNERSINSDLTKRILEDRRIEIDPEETKAAMLAARENLNRLMKK